MVCRREAEATGLVVVVYVAQLLRGFFQFTKQTCESGGLVVCVEAARIRQHPEHRVSDPIFLPAYGCFRLIERGAVGSDSQHGQSAWAVTKHLRSQSFSSGN